MPRDAERLDDILAAAADVMEFMAGLSREDFDKNKVIRYAILHSLTIIGEASGRLSDKIRASWPDIPWRRIIAFRNRLVHGYGEVDLDLVWGVAVTLVPEFQSQIAVVRATLPSDD